MSERSGIHLTGVDSGWPVAGSAEASPKKSGAYNGDAGNPHANSIAGGTVTTSTSVNEVQTLTVDASTGNFTLSFNGRVTANIGSEATAAAVKAALVANTELTTNDITVTGSAGGPYTITFVGPDYAHKNVPAIVAASVDLGGTGAHTAVITTPTPGVA